MNKKVIVRYADTDIMRITASFFVVLLHTAAYSASIGVLASGTAQIINIFCRFSLPVFFMVSGRYMLEKEADLVYLLKKSLKIFIVLIFTSAVYAAFEYGGSSPAELISYILTAPLHLWYLYATICLYLFTPAISIFMKSAEKKYVLYIIFLCFFFGSFLYIPLNSPGFDTLKEVIKKCKLDCTLGFVGCYMLGYFFYRFRIPRIAKYIIYLAGIAGLAVSLIGNGSQLLSCRVKELLLSFFAPNVLCQSAAFFVFVKEIASSLKIRKTAAYFISIAARCTGGIYLWHVLILKLFFDRINYRLNAADIISAAVIIYSFILIILMPVYNALIRNRSKCRHVLT